MTLYGQTMNTLDRHCTRRICGWSLLCCVVHCASSILCMSEGIMCWVVSLLEILIFFLMNLSSFRAPAVLFTSQHTSPSGYVRSPGAAGYRIPTVTPPQETLTYAATERSDIWGNALASRGDAGSRTETQCTSRLAVPRVCVQQCLKPQVVC